MIDQRVSRVVTGVALLSCLACADDPAPPSGSVQPEFLNLAPDVEYTGIESCRSCHLGVSATYAETGMARSFGPAPRGEVDVSRETGWAMGSGNHLRALLVEDGGGLRFSGDCWNAAESNWLSCSAEKDGNAHLTGSRAGCAFCHNAAVDPSGGNLPHGIDCERCHGPGQLHLARWSATSERGTGDPDPTIVNPRRLPPAERRAVCLQCHLSDDANTARIRRDGRRPEEFRPGQPLSELVVAYRFVEGDAGRFGAAAQGDRMVLSRCYVASAGALDCLTCHNPHVSVYHEERPADLFRRQCLRCHSADGCAAPPQTRRATQPADDCVACHMRRATPHDLRSDGFTDHWIRRRDDDSGERGSYEVEPVFPRDLERLSAGEREYYRARAELALAARAPESARNEMLTRAEAGFLRAIDGGHDTREAKSFLEETRRLLTE